MQFVHQPAPKDRLGEFLKANLSGPWTSFRAAIAFVKQSGTNHIASYLANFARGRDVEVLVGIDHRGTSREGLEELLNCVGSGGRIIIFHNTLPITFHPKLYLFKSASAAELLIGSGNLTGGGIFNNYEASIRLSLDLSQDSERLLLQSVESVLDEWADLSTGTARLLDAQLLAQLVALGYVPVEALAAPEMDGVGEVGGEDGAREEDIASLFSAHQEPMVPVVHSGRTARVPTPLLEVARSAATDICKHPAEAAD